VHMTILWLTLAISMISMLYAAVGQAGGSGYLAAMALLGFAPTEMRPTALVLNVLVAAVATAKFYRAGYVSWITLWPFALTSVPAAFIGGRLSLESATYNVVVGVVLLFAAYRIFRLPQEMTSTTIQPPPLWLALVFGLGVGLASGLTGIGGGVIFGPLLLWMGWAEAKQTFGLSAAMNLSNSAAGLIGHLSSMVAVPGAIPLWAAAAMIGAEYGSLRLSHRTLQRLLAAVLTVAGLKLIFA
jgi:uncharacterized membrane protein YfcA